MYKSRKLSNKPTRPTALFNIFFNANLYILG